MTPIAIDETIISIGDSITLIGWKLIALYRGSKAFSNPKIDPNMNPKTEDDIVKYFSLLVFSLVILKIGIHYKKRFN